MRQLFSALAAAWLFSVVGSAHGAEHNASAVQYLGLIENFAGFAERHWNEKTQSYDAAGSGVTWARGNGGVCLVHAVLLTESPERESFSPQRISRELMIDHVRRTLRTLCLTSKS